MSYEFFRKLPTPLEIKTMYPVSDEVAKQKELFYTPINEENIESIVKNIKAE